MTMRCDTDGSWTGRVACTKTARKTGNEDSGGGNEVMLDGQCDPNEGECDKAPSSPSPLLIVGSDRGKNFYPGINSPNQPVKLSRHHMCPNQVLKDFWNALVENKYLRIALSAVFDEMKVIHMLCSPRRVCVRIMYVFMCARYVCVYVCEREKDRECGFACEYTYV